MAASFGIIKFGTVMNGGHGSMSTLTKVFAVATKGVMPILDHISMRAWSANRINFDGDFAVLPRSESNNRSPNCAHADEEIHPRAKILNIKEIVE